MAEFPGVQSGKRICLVPRLRGVGGMVSFQHKLAAGLVRRGIDVCYDLDDPPYQSILVIGGTRQLAGLWRARRRGMRVVQRLDGMNWLHRVIRPRPSLRHYLRAEYGNWILSSVRNHLAEEIVYQSDFSRDWWEREHGPAPVEHTVIHNGVDLTQYTPDGDHQRPQDAYRVLMVEGSLMGGYERGLETGVALIEGLAQEISHSQIRKPLELLVVGRVPLSLQQTWEAKSSIHLHWGGLVPSDEIPQIDRSAHLLFSADLNAACPNSVIEALACGLPVVAFDTGALGELVTPDAGRIVAYGGDPWALDPPDIPALVAGALEILANQVQLRTAARQRAEQALGLEQMVERYLEVLLDG